jgi:hypothetical protein
MIVENKHRLLNPILSRFCDIYVPEYICDGKVVNLHQHAMKKKYDLSSMYEENRGWMKEYMDAFTPLKISNLQQSKTAVSESASTKLPVTDLKQAQKERLCRSIVGPPLLGGVLPSASLEGADSNLNKFTHRYNPSDYSNLMNAAIFIYEHGYSAMDVMEYIVNENESGQSDGKWTKEQCAGFSISFHKIKSEFRCEKLLIFYILDMVFYPKDENFSVPKSVTHNCV